MFLRALRVHVQALMPVSRAEPGKYVGHRWSKVVVVHKKVARGNRQTYLQHKMVASDSGWGGKVIALRVKSSFLPADGEQTTHINTQTHADTHEYRCSEHMQECKLKEYMVVRHMRQHMMREYIYL